MTIKKKDQIIIWMSKHWQSKDVFDDAIQHFGKTEEVIIFCKQIAKKIEKVINELPNYIKKEITK